MTQRSFWTIGTLVLTIALCASFLIWFLPVCRSYPSSDEWDYLVPMTEHGAPRLSWLFAQHVDHRIPLQKAIHFVTLHATQFDFRSLVALNSLFAGTSAVLFALAARAYRGISSIGDLFIPLTLLSLGAGYMQWGFEFQFLSTITVFAGFLLCAAHGRNALAFALLFLCSWTGLNGMLMSTFITCITAAYLIMKRHNPGRASCIALGVTLLQNAALWLSWTPTAASDRHATPIAILKFVAGMTNAPLLVYASPHPWWKLTIFTALIVVGVYIAAVQARKKNTLSWHLLLASLTAAVLLTIATAYGRAKEMPWSPGLEMHYGSLAMLMPILAWIAVSSSPDLPKRATILTGVMLIALFGRAYWANYQWRESFARDNRSLDMAAAAAIYSGTPPQQVAHDHMLRYFYVDTPETRVVVSNGIQILRSQRGTGN